MSFVKCYNFPLGMPPTRAYLHSAGLHEAFGTENPFQVAEEHLVSILEEDRELLIKYDYLLCALWGLDTNRRMDLFGFKDIREWPGNPDVYPLVYEDKTWLNPDEYGLTCGDFLMVLGQEETYRRITNREQYFAQPPSIELQLLE